MSSRAGHASRPTVDQTLDRLDGVLAAVGPPGKRRSAVGGALARALALQFGLSFDRSRIFASISRFTTHVLKLMQRHPFVPIAEHDGVHRGDFDPQNLLALDELELLLGRELELVSAPGCDPHRAGTERRSSQALRELEVEYRSMLVKEDERGEEILTSIRPEKTKVLRSNCGLNHERDAARASDIHVEAADRATKVNFASTGFWSPPWTVGYRLHAPLVSRLKVMSIGYRRAGGPPGRDFRMRLERKTVDFRVSILRASSANRW